MQYFLVHWEDSHGDGSWCNPEDVDDWSLGITSIGILVSEDDQSITLCTSKSDGGQVQGCIKIPKSCIKKQWEVDLS